MEHREFITVAVAFDRHTVPLTRMAASICRATGKKLCLLHVVEPWADHPHSKPFGGEEDQFWNVTQAVETNARELALSRLGEVGLEVPPDIAVKKVVVGGKPVETICKEVEAIGTCMLLVGGHYGNMRFMPKGLSTALSLSVSCPVPLMVVDTAQEQSLRTSNLKFLLSDDLSDQSEGAVEFTFDLASALGRCEVHHVHINGLTFESLKAGLNTAAATSHTPLNSSASVDDVYGALMTSIDSRLAGRAAALRDYLDASGGTYFSEVATGDVSEEISKVAEDTAADVIVFGRHHTWHKKPFFIGRVPFRSMLGQQKPVIIVPND
jgi:nucleotide-binding universal stress UspA family protein